MPSDRDELLDRVYRRATRLRVTRRLLPAGAAVLALIAGLAVVPQLGDDGPRRVNLAVGNQGDGDGSTTTLPEVGSTEPGGAPGAGVTTTTVAGAMRPDGNVSSPIMTTTTRRIGGGPVATTTTAAGGNPADRCRNNNGDASCGEFRWATNPGPNAPLQFTITASPAQPKVGQEVTFTVRVVDPDASPVTSCGDAYDDQPTFAAVGCVHTMECAANYGPWDVPAKQAGEATFTYKHAFVSAGAHTAEFHAQSLQGSKSAGQCAARPNPYASEGSATKTLTVVPA